MQNNYSIKVYKQYFNFSAAHFLIFKDGSREPLHGHNYYVKAAGLAPQLEEDVVFDFLDIKPIIREICDSLDHKVLLPKENESIKIEESNNNLQITTPDGSQFSFPKQDTLLLPLHNTSAERLAIYISDQVLKLVQERFNFQFSQLDIEVEETQGQSASYSSHQNSL